MDHKPKCIANILKILEENIGKYLCDLKVDNNFLERLQKHEVIYWCWSKLKFSALQKIFLKLNCDMQTGREYF